jgi:hypothetical protein
MFVCPKCKQSFKSAEELNEHFNQNDECRGYAKKIMISAGLLATLDVNKRIDIFLKKHTSNKVLIADGDRHVYTEVEI